MRVVVVDTYFANLTSVGRAIEEAAKLSGESVTVQRSRDPRELAKADKIVVPGQGAFRECILSLDGELHAVLLEKVRTGTPYFGICLGLQALFDGSEEAVGIRGLGLLSGQNRKLAPSPGVKIPHMGWNQLEARAPSHSYLEASGNAAAWFYFVHSYHAEPADPSVVVATVTHGNHRITAAVAKDNLFATQFHPEKSQAAGLRLLNAFLKA